MGDSGASNFQESMETLMPSKPTPGKQQIGDKLLQGLHLQPLDKSFIRNILFKYLEYTSTGEEKEALQLEKVLFTVLDATPENLDSLAK